MNTAMIKIIKYYEVTIKVTHLFNQRMILAQTFADMIIARFKLLFFNVLLLDVIVRF